ncbi:hypothetical protein JHJ32_10795 [Parapedobacter sp. ISTM3]|uniref:Outer membrane protein beta-barrel domain-containing protein n=1 Tax=Parapedobacter luteus TaxID=623280 RepID=A0A1T5B367_9SPHI|nr:MULTISPECIES: hypothetical protein [Parapedobacter]MBK1440474.1 hypothetical protein [Parapedobacter sp. ISTM3]SKB41507.1 hypothetical protein SAMN05660226_01299 [Parapedobacter luteus]
MKKIFFTSLFCTLLLFTTHYNASAQSYRTGAGLFIDAGDGRTFVGPHIKHFFSANNAGQAMILFADRTTIIGAEYSYNQPIPGAQGLSWNVGVGPQVAIRRENSDFLIRPMLGLEFKIPSAPLAFGFDWRPWWNVSDSFFRPGRFGLAFKFTF